MSTKIPSHSKHTIEVEDPETIHGHQVEEQNAITFPCHL